MGQNINTPLPILGLQGAISTTAIGLVSFGFTQDQVDNAAKAYFTIHTNGIRYRFDGTNPTTLVGHIALSNDASKIFQLGGNENLQLLRMIRDGVSDSELFVTLVG